MTKNYTKKILSCLVTSLPRYLATQAIILLLLTTLTSQLTTQVSAQTINTISISPSSQTVDDTDQVTASIDITDGFNTGAFQLQLNFDPTILQLDSAIVGEYLGSTGRTVSTTGTTINNEAGTLSLGYFTFGASPDGPSGSGTLINLSFTSLSQGESSIDLSQIIITDISGASQSFTSNNGTITITQEPDLDPTPTPTQEPDPNPNTGEATLWITGPDTTTRFDPFAVDVMVNTQVATTGIDVIIEFNPQRLTAESITVSDLLPDSPYQNINNGNGTIVFSMLTNPDEPFTGTGSLATIEFTPKIAGTADISFDFTPGSTTDSNIISAATGQDILASAESHQIEIIDLPPTIQINLTTPSTNPTLGHSLTGTLTHNLNPEFSLEVIINPEGQSEIIELDQSLLGETPTFTFKADTFLTKSTTVTLQPEANFLDFGLLPAGDLNNDGIINTMDLGIMYDQWFTQGTADFNRDGLVNSADHWTLLQNYLKVDE